MALPSTPRKEIENTTAWMYRVWCLTHSKGECCIVKPRIHCVCMIEMTHTCIYSLEQTPNFVMWGCWDWTLAIGKSVSQGRFGDVWRPDGITQVESRVLTHLSVWCDETPWRKFRKKGLRKEGLTSAQFPVTDHHSKEIPVLGAWGRWSLCIQSRGESNKFVCSAHFLLVQNPIPRGGATLSG